MSRWMMGLVQFEVFKEHPIQIIVIVLPRMRQQTVKVLTALVYYRRQTDNLRAGTNYDEKLQLPVIFKCLHIEIEHVLVLIS